MSRVTFFILSFEYMRQFYHLKLLKSALVVHCLTFIWNKKRLIKGRFWDEKAKGGFLFWKVLRENQLYNFFLLLGLANHLPPGGFVRPSGVGGVEIWKKKKLFFFFLLFLFWFFDFFFKNKHLFFISILITLK